MENPRIIIVGSSLSAATAFLNLQKMLSKTREQHDLLLITDKDFFSVNSMRTNYLSGSCLIEDISEEFRKIGYLSPSTSVIRVDSYDDLSIDLENKVVLLPDSEYAYKTLVLAAENDSNEVDFPVSGEDFFTAKTVAEIKKLKAHIIDTIYRASVETDEEKKKSLMSFSVIGGNEYGVELACNISDFVDDLIKRQYPELNTDSKKIYLIEEGKNIDISADSYMSNDIFYSLNKKSISLKLDTSILGVHGDVVELEQNKKIKSSTIIAVGKNNNSSLINKLNIADKDSNKVLIDLYLKPKEYDGLFVIGESSKHLDVVGKLIFNSSFYSHQAKHCAKNVMLEVNGNEPEAIQFDSCATYISLGKRDSAFAYRNYKFRGLFGWLLHVITSVSCLLGVSKKISSFLSMLSFVLGGKDISFIDESQIALTKTKVVREVVSKE